MFLNRLHIGIASAALAFGSVANAAVTFGTFGASSSAARDVAQNLGHSASVLPDLTAGSLAGIDVLWALNSDNGSQLLQLSANQAAVTSFVNNGGVFLYHDREVDAAESVLPGGGGFDIQRLTSAEIDVQDATTTVTNGPGGVITDTTLDGGNLSNHGFTVAGTLPAGATKILNNGTVDNLVDATYAHGSGFVHYSTIPLDFYLDGNNPAAFRDTYAPNVAAYAAELSVIPSPSAAGGALAIFGLAGGLVRRRASHSR